MENEEQFIAVYDGYVGMGNTLEIAFGDLINTCRESPDMEEVTFFKGKELRIKMQLVEYDENDATQN